MLSPYDNHVPDELMQELHAAVEHFTKSQHLLDEALASTEQRHQERIDLATDEVRRAEGEMEHVNRKIDEFLYAGEGHA